jgi:hypothetical protein
MIVCLMLPCLMLPCLITFLSAITDTIQLRKNIVSDCYILGNMGIFPQSFEQRNEEYVEKMAIWPLPSQFGLALCATFLTVYTPQFSTTVLWERKLETVWRTKKCLGNKNYYFCLSQS